MLFESYLSPLERLSKIKFLVFTVLVSAIIAPCFFAPHLWLIAGKNPGTFLWSRALTFIAQCEDPFRRDIELAMQWRLLPPLVCHYLGLKGNLALIFPFIGTLLLLFTIAHILLKETQDKIYTFIGTILVATTSSILVSITWFGINDCWFLTGLLLIAFGEGGISLILACLLSPWVDERAIIALPLALGCRYLISRNHISEQQQKVVKEIIIAGLLIIFYLIVRFTLSKLLLADNSDAFIKETLSHFSEWILWSPLGWLFGFRAAWLLIGFGVFVLYRRSGLLASASTIAITFIIYLTISILASDTSRSSALILPLLILSIIYLKQEIKLLLPYLNLTPTTILMILLLINLILPVRHVTYTKTDAINCLPIELYRLAKKR